MSIDVIKIVVTGPESTGKSTLCEALADHYQTVWCPEYARAYLHEHGPHYTYDDLLMIAKGQLALEEKTKQEAIQLWQQQDKSTLIYNQLILVVDTDMYVMKVWSEFVFNKVDPFIIAEIERQQTNLYLLCNIDLPWVEDELREYPDIERRQQLFEIYRQIMMHQQVPWVLVQGPHHLRVETAVKAIDSLLLSLS